VAGMTAVEDELELGLPWIDSGEGGKDEVDGGFTEASGDGEFWRLTQRRYSHVRRARKLVDSLLLISSPSLYYF